MASKTVTIDGLGTVHLFKRKKSSSIRLSITHDGTIRVNMPYWLPFTAGTEFVKTKRDWISSKQIIALPLTDGGHIGKAHRLKFIPEVLQKKITTRITTSGEIRVFYPQYLHYTDTKVQNAAERAAIKALRQQAEVLLPQRLELLARQYGFTYSDVIIKRLKSRWGSCSNEKVITLNCYLMQLPWQYIDYVIMHELLHTKIMAHGKLFWSELSHYIPNLSEVRKEMRKHRPVLLVT